MDGLKQHFKRADILNYIGLFWYTVYQFCVIIATIFLGRCRSRFSFNKQTQYIFLYRLKIEKTKNISLYLAMI